MGFVKEGMGKMVEIQNVLRDKYYIVTDIRTDVSLRDGMLFGDNGFIKVQAESPCLALNCREEQKKWLLRMAPSQSFDRWSVSAAVVERFDSPEQMAAYLADSSVVYKLLFEKLSEDYRELEEKYIELEYGDCDSVSLDEKLHACEGVNSTGGKGMDERDFGR